MPLTQFLKTINNYFVVLLCFTVSACGGGGGSQTISTPTPVGFQVSVDRTALLFEGEVGRSFTPVAILGTGVGTLPGTIYTGSLDLGTSLEQVTAEVIGAQLKFAVYPKSNLSAGTYNGSLQLFACADAKCTQHFSGSPATVPYTVVVTKTFKASPASVNLAVISGASTSRDIVVELPPKQSSFQVNSSSSWLTITNQTTTGFTLKTAPLPPGDFTATVSVSYPGRNLDIPVHLTVSGDSSTVTRIIPDITNLNFNALAGALQTAPLAVNLTLPSWSNESKMEISYSSTASDWLSVTKINERKYSVTASPQNLASGTYTALLNVKSDPLTAAISIPVNFVVGAPSWTIVGTSDFLVDGKTEAAQLASDLSIDLPGLSAQGWTASSNASWLKLLNTSGTTGITKLQVAVDNNELLNMSNFTVYSADVMISSASGKVPAKRLTFTISKNLPQINFITPATRLPGEATTAIVRGRGFNSVINLDQALAVTGLPVKRITRVNDTQLLLQLDAASQGETAVTMKNALGFQTGSSTTKVVPQRTYSYRAIPTQGAKGSIHFDAERQSIYTSNKELGSVMRFAAIDNSWSISSATVTSIDSAAMSPDAKSLVTTSTNGKITLLDASSLETQGTYTTNYIAGDRLNSLPRLAMTNNGRVFFQGSTWASGLSYFDLSTRKFDALKSTSVQFSFYNGPWFNVSGDGDRLLVVQSASTSPSPAMLYLDATDEIVKVNPAGITFWYEAAQSLHGERFIEGTYKVWDRDFNLIGNVVLPDNNYFGRAPVFAPDGNRVYILTYNASVFSSNNIDSTTKPRVYVIDTSKRLVTTTTLPVLGYFDVNDYPTCANSSYGCDTRPLGTISPDGKTLFFIGNKNLIVAPIPSLQTVSPAPLIQQASKDSKSVPTKMTHHEMKK